MSTLMKAWGAVWEERLLGFSFLHQHWYFHISMERKRDLGAETQNCKSGVPWELFVVYVYIVLHESQGLRFNPRALGLLLYTKTEFKIQPEAIPRQSMVKHEWSQCNNSEKSKGTTWVRWSWGKERIIKITRPISTFSLRLGLERQA